jgi:glycosyltransferase involved in cell wall biosynthesis
MHTPPTVSVIMGTMRDTYLQEAVESILNQTFRDFEFLILIEPGSTAKIPHDDRIRTIACGKHISISDWRNRGLRRSRGRYFVIHDDDDLSEPSRFDKQVSFLDTHPEIAGVATWTKRIGADGGFNGDWKPPADPELIARAMSIYNQLISGSMMCRREIFERIGRFNDRFLFAEDYEYWMRAIAAGFKFAYIPEHLFSYRFHPDMTSTRHRQVQVATTERIQIKYGDAYYKQLCREAHLEQTRELLEGKEPLALGVAEADPLRESPCPCCRLASAAVVENNVEAGLHVERYRCRECGQILLEKAGPPESLVSGKVSVDGADNQLR